MSEFLLRQFKSKKEQALPVVKILCKIKDLIKSIDSYFFGTDDEEEEIKPYFYGSIASGTIVALFTLLTII